MIGLLLCLPVLVLALPAFAMLALTIAASWPAPRRAPAAVASMPARVAVLVPAHDESHHVLPTIRSVQAQLEPGDRILVVADNCSDDTAALARAAGAEVTERHDPGRRGKGYALAHGIEWLRADPPKVVCIVDADCTLGEGALAHVVAACHAQQRPAQMLNLMRAPAGASLRQRVLEFAMVMKNLVRPLGSDRLGGACHLMGTGMALPWALAANAPWATGHVAEDMKLGVELTRAGHAPRFVPQARVSSSFVADDETTRRQKARWEHGHLDILREQLPSMWRDAFAHRSGALAALAADLTIPPLALFAAWLAVAWPVFALAGWLWPAAAAAAWLATSATAAFFIALGLGWWGFGRDLIRARELWRLPLYVAWKLPVYLAYARGLRSGWTRTARATATDGGNQPQTGRPA